MEIEFNRDKFINELRRYLDQNSQDDLAAAAGISQGAVAMYLNQPKDRPFAPPRIPRADNLARIANALGVPVTAFYTVIDSESTELVTSGESPVEPEYA